MTVAELKKLVGNSKLILGMQRTLKEVKRGNVKTVFLAKNCSKEMKESIEVNAKMSKTEVSQLDITNDDMGVAVKKPFAVSVACLLK
jgi:ribosomal protein L30E